MEATARGPESPRRLRVVVVGGVAAIVLPHGAKHLAVVVGVDSPVLDKCERLVVGNTLQRFAVLLVKIDRVGRKQNVVVKYHAKLFVVT